MNQPTIIVIFGAGGDLTRRKLIPALVNLHREELLPQQFMLLGTDRLELDDEAYRQFVDKDIRQLAGEKFAEEAWQHVRQAIHYQQGDFTDAASYQSMKLRLQQLAGSDIESVNCMFYLATPPAFFGVIAQQLGTAGLAAESNGAWRRLIIEKPFGRDYESATALNRVLHESFSEQQIYRIDHYLGKETVQNILAYRFGNGTVEPIWSRRYIDHVQITVSESLGVEHRAGYYETAGALRDMIVNHLLAVLSVVAMEPSNTFEANAIRDEQVKVLKAVRKLTPEQVITDTVRGQYGSGRNGSDEDYAAYRDEPGVEAGSNTETFVALKLMIDTWRWAGVPFYLRTGKRMSERYTEVVIHFKHAPNMLFQNSVARQQQFTDNELILHIQPHEGISSAFNAKVPGTTLNVSTVKMTFDYKDYFDHSGRSDGYDTLIYDCLVGDSTLFKRSDHIETCWQLVQPILDVWQAMPARDFPNYDAGTTGPPSADKLLARDGRNWRSYQPLKS